MTRKDILKNYNVDLCGRIVTPGKFVREMLYVPYFWEVYLDGRANRDNGFAVTREDKVEFPELTGRRTIKLKETELGFVVEV